MSVAGFLSAIMSRTPNGEWIRVQYHPDGDWSVATGPDERDERIKALEAGGNKLLRVADDKLATRSEWSRAVRDWRDLIDGVAR